MFIAIVLLRSVPVASAALLMLVCSATHAQALLQPSSPHSILVLPPGDDAVLESEDTRNDLRCVVRPMKPVIGFDMKFHSGFAVTLGLSGLSDHDELLTTIFRVNAVSHVSGNVYFADHIRVPAAPEGREGEATLQGTFDLGEGDYHIDWLMRDALQRVCSSHWDVSARLSQKQRLLRPAIAAGQVMPSAAGADRFSQLTASKAPEEQGVVRISVIANLGSRGYTNGGTMPADMRAVVSTLQTIAREPGIGSVSVAVVDILGRRVIYTNNGSEQIDWLSIAESTNPQSSLTIDAKQLGGRYGEAEFLANVAVQELETHPNALIFISPKLSSDLKMPREVLERFAGGACPVFYVSIDVDPAKDPFRDLIANTTRYLKGIVYTIRQPEDVLRAWSDMTGRFMR